MKNKFGIRDLVNAGVFSLLTLMATWCGGMIGFIPVLMPLVPFFLWSTFRSCIYAILNKD